MYYAKRPLVEALNCLPKKIPLENTKENAEENKQQEEVDYKSEVFDEHTDTLNYKKSVTQNNEDREGRNINALNSHIKSEQEKVDVIFQVLKPGSSEEYVFPKAKYSQKNFSRMAAGKIYF